MKPRSILARLREHKEEIAPSVTVSFRAPKPLIDAIDFKAKAEGSSRTDAILRALDKYASVK